MVSESKAVREILFRGKRVDNGEIVEGFYIFDGFNHYIVKFYTDENAEGTLYPVQEAFEVIPETVGQFTGLTDMNGKKIFEGDVVRCIRTHCDGKEMVGHIVFADCCFCVKDIKTINRPAMDLCGDFEVIGNIHDNPELLEGCNG